MTMIREYFSCEISKFSLDWFMHSYYRRYIKLHNAMFECIRWNAMLQSTRCHKYGLGAQTHSATAERINNLPKLYCAQGTRTELFRGPPHKKRKLAGPVLSPNSRLRIKLPAKLKLENVIGSESMSESSSSMSSDKRDKWSKKHPKRAE